MSEGEMSDQWDGGRAECNCPGMLRLRAENEHLRTQISLLTQIIELEFARRQPDGRKRAADICRAMAAKLCVLEGK